MSDATIDTATEDVPLADRIRENPRPAAVWAGVFLVLVAVEFGALATATLELAETFLLAVSTVLGMVGVDALSGVVDALDGLQSTTRSWPTLLSREVIDNSGHRAMIDGRLQWTGTTFGVEPKWAWLARLVLIYGYAFFFAYWVWRGYFVFRDHYRQADWTPRDDVVRRMRGHRWGQFGFVVVFMFLTMAIFAPAMSPTTVERNIANPCSHETQFYHDEVGEVRTVQVCDANTRSASNGAGDMNVGPLQYDQYDRYHPFGTLPTPGKDLFTFMVAGSRISLFVGLLAIGIGGGIAVVFALVTAYYKGLVDLAVVIAGDSIMSLPQLLLLILVSAVFRGHWLRDIYSGGLLIALVLGFTNWPYLWRAVRGPAFQISEQEWIDAARSYGQRASATMRRHMLPYIVGYLLIYGSMTLGGIILATSALSFLGLGIQPPTPEWGRAIGLGQPYVATQSWHISLVPGVLITLVVLAFNALGDGIRDAIDPKSEGGSSSEVTAAGGGGG